MWPVFYKITKVAQIDGFTLSQQQICLPAISYDWIPRMQMRFTFEACVFIMRTASTKLCSSLFNLFVWRLTMKRRGWPAGYDFVCYTQNLTGKVRLWWGIVEEHTHDLRHAEKRRFPMFCLHQNAKALKAKKEEGNQAFKKCNYEAAYRLYTEALMIDPNNIKTNAKLYCNRATAGAKVSWVFHIMTKWIKILGEKWSFFPLSTAK